MIKCPWYNNKINTLSLVLPHHKNFHQINNTSLSQFGFSKSDNTKTKYQDIEYCYGKNKSEQVVKTFSYKINPSNEQKEKLFHWFEICNCVYNYCVMTFNKNPSGFSLNYKKQKLVIFNSIFGKEKKPVPYDILTDVIRQFCDNVKACFSNLRNKNIKHFRMKFKPKPEKYSILIPKKSINSFGFFP